MERVVYVLGAGFSAPLGLPTMRDFLDKSKDMASAEPERWGYFETLFKKVREVDGAGKYFAGDYFNVEEMLSLLEMRADLGDLDLRKDLERYIRAVIQHYTPMPEPHEKPWPSNWPDVIFGKGRLAGEYGSFVCCLLGITLTGPAPHDMAAVLGNSAHATEYAVVSLNYDRVLENSASFLASALGAKGPLRFRRPGDKQEDAPRPVLAKLHGDVEGGPIVALTWSKGLPQELVADWKAAEALMADATQLRFLGYSLPAGDARVRYLLKSAIASGQRVKRIDVICRDARNGEVRDRWNEFVRFPNWTFSNSLVEEYLTWIAQSHETQHVTSGIVKEFRNLESAHLGYMEAHSDR